MATPIQNMNAALSAALTAQSAIAERNLAFNALRGAGVIPGSANLGPAIPAANVIPIRAATELVENAASIIAVDDLGPGTIYNWQLEGATIAGTGNAAATPPVPGDTSATGTSRSIVIVTGQRANHHVTVTVMVTNVASGALFGEITIPIR